MRDMIDIQNNAISIRKQCSFLGLPRSSYYYEPKAVSEEALTLMHAIDEIYTKHPYYGNRRMMITITRPGEVYSSDITYIRLAQGFIYLVAIIDWHSRYVVSWRVSTSLDIDFCIDALINALEFTHEL